MVAEDFNYFNHKWLIHLTVEIHSQLILLN